MVVAQTGARDTRADRGPLPAVVASTSSAYSIAKIRYDYRMDNESRHQKKTDAGREKRNITEEVTSARAGPCLKQ